MEEIKSMLPYIICGSIILNILGNTIKLTFNVNSKYIVWILMLVSIIINFMFFKISFKSLFIGMVTFSFSVSSYDLIKNSRKIISKY